MVQKLLSSQLVRFLLTGGGTTGLDFILYMIGSQMLPTTPAKVISMMGASILSYCLNKKYTFKNEKKDRSQIIRFYVIFGLNFIANVSMNQIAFDITTSRVFGFVVGTVCGLTVNYIGQKFFVFR